MLVVGWKCRHCLGIKKCPCHRLCLGNTTWEQVLSATRKEKQEGYSSLLSSVETREFLFDPVALHLISFKC